MLQHKDYCDKDLSLALKEIGYIGQGRCYYDLDKEPNKLRHFGIQVLTTRSAGALNFVLAVHLYDAQKWLRKQKGILILPDYNSFGWFCGIHYPINSVKMFKYTAKEVNSYEEALSEGIKEAIKILKDEQTN